SRQRMRIAYEISIRTRTGSVGDARTISVNAVGHRERRTALGSHDACELPAAQSIVREAGAAEKRQGIYPARRQYMPLIEIRAGVVFVHIRRVDKVAVEFIGRVIEGMAVGVSHAQG